MRFARPGWMIALVGLVLLATACSSTDTKPEVRLPDDLIAPATTTSVVAPTTTTLPEPSVPLELREVKFRSTPVDVSSFEHLPGRGSVVAGAWYDPVNEYMLLDLGGTNYHYCEVPLSVWSGFRAAGSLGTFYSGTIRGSFGCGDALVPEYGSGAAAGGAEATPPEADQPPVRTFDGDFASAARVAYWLTLMNDYGGYDAPIDVVDDAAWFSEMFDAIARSNDSCDAWGRALEVHLSSEDIYSIRPPGWSPDDAYYELAASIIAFSSGQDTGDHWSALGMLYQCYDPATAPSSVNELLGSVAPGSWENQKRVFGELMVELIGSHADDPMYVHNNVMKLDWARFGYYDRLAEESESCADWYERMDPEIEKVSLFAGQDEYDRAFVSAAILAIAGGPARMVFNVCGI